MLARIIVLFLYIGKHLQISSGAHILHSSYNLEIINGVDATPHEVPSMVRVVIRRGNITDTCGGSLIRPQFVLTAAHCLQVPNISVVDVFLGAHNETLADADQVIEALHHTTHPQYTLGHSAHDVAVLKLTSPALIKPRLVETAALADHASYDGAIVVEYGWGFVQQGPDRLPSVLQKLRSKVHPYRDCSAYWRTSDITLCVSRLDDTPGTSCHGDSGDPLIKDGRQVGVASGGVTFDARRCHTSPFTVFTRVDHHRKWMEDVMAKM